MSIRTIVEFNHDYIDRLLDQGHISKDFYRWLMAYHHSMESPPHIAGARILGTRHHSETLMLEVE